MQKPSNEFDIENANQAELCSIEPMLSLQDREALVMHRSKD